MLAPDPRLGQVAVRLGELRDKVVFVGGAILSLLIDDPGASAVRPTDDVDLVVVAPSLSAYYSLSASLTRLGFTPDASEGAPLCRWIVDGIVVDVMPTSREALGFSNRWYEATLAHAVTREVAPGVPARVAALPYFIATKLEAFEARGNRDFVASHDLEDIIAVLDGNDACVAEVSRCDEEVRAFLAERFRLLLSEEGFLDSLPGHLAGDAASQARRAVVLDRMKAISTT